jgi:cupin 2 domain-containing protein
VKNLFADIPESLPEELTEVLAEHQHIRIERVVSTGHASPEGFWYDQDEHEWVVVYSVPAAFFALPPFKPPDLFPGRLPQERGVLRHIASLRRRARTTSQGRKRQQSSSRSRYRIKIACAFGPM